jgi:hypothetical protein
MVALLSGGGRWVGERDLKKRTREEYERIVRLHIVPYLGTKPLADVSPPVVRSWRGQLREKGVGEPTVAKSYRILHATSRLRSMTILCGVIPFEYVGRRRRGR